MKDKFDNIIYRILWRHYTWQINFVLRVERFSVEKKYYKLFEIMCRRFDKLANKRFELLKNHYWKIES